MEWLWFLAFLTSVLLKICGYEMVTVLGTSDCSVVEDVKL